MPTTRTTAKYLARRLPEELEYVIFQLAAWNHRSSVPRFLLVARRVKAWLEPVLYSTLMHTCLRSHQYPPITTSPKPLNSTTTPNIRISRHFRRVAPFFQHVMLQDLCAETALAILALCVNTTNLALWRLTGELHILQPVIRSMPLQRISLNVAELQAMPGSGRDHRPFSFDHTLYHSSLTHLDIILMPSLNWESWSNLALMPNLTHLSCDFDSPTLLLKILEHCPNLKMILFSAQQSWFRSDTSEEVQRDSKVVRLNTSVDLIPDWERGTFGNDDVWERAERVLERRKIEKEHTSEGEEMDGIVEPSV